MAAGFSPDAVPSDAEKNKYRNVSLKLYNTLESCVFSDDCRQLTTNIARINEIMTAFSSKPYDKFYIFGSSYEGSHTLTMGSDVDLVYISCLVPVVCQAECMSDLQYPCRLLLIPDQRFPGYAKLQVLLDGKEKVINYEVFAKLSSFYVEYECRSDSQNRQCLTSKYRKDVNQHGPAFQVKHHSWKKSTDYVFAFECDTCPSIAAEWLTRRREYGWPSDDLIQKIKTYGFIVVKACHPQSDEKDLQWRISFSRQERELVVNFNSVQIKCYVLLKLIKKDIINKEMGEETLTSYHCKTCMFYMLENTPEELWIPENLASCLLMSLRQIRMWVLNRHCPNYFIPGENMFDRITSEDSKMKLMEILDKIISSDIENLIMEVTIDELAKIFRACGVFEPSIATVLNHCSRVYTVMGLSLTLLLERNNILFAHYNNNIEIFNENIRMKMDNMWRTSSFPDQVKEESIAKYLITPFLQLAFLTNTTVKQLIRGGDELRATLVSEQWDKLDVTGISKLKQATISLAMNDNNFSLNILLDVARNSKLPFCVCDSFNLVIPRVTAFSSARGYALREEIFKLFRHFLLSCVCFLPCESLITPFAIRYEMIRCFGVSVADRDFVFDYWFDWGMVDGIFLTNFLMYLNYKALRRMAEARNVVKKMILHLNSGTVSHRETCLNLLGWVHMERRNVGRAVQCLTKSLKERPKYNAAYWHLCFLICGV